MRHHEVRIDRPRCPKGEGSGGDVVGKRRRASRRAVERERLRARCRARERDCLLVAAENRLVVHDAGAGADDRLRIDRPRDAEARSPVVLVGVEAARLRQGGVGESIGIFVDVVTQAVEDLQCRRDLPVVLDKDARDVGRHVEAEVARDLRHRAIAERCGAALRRQV